MTGTKLFQPSSKGCFVYHRFSCFVYYVSFALEGTGSVAASEMTSPRRLCLCKVTFSDLHGHDW